MRTAGRCAGAVLRRQVHPSGGFGLSASNGAVRDEQKASGPWCSSLVQTNPHPAEGGGRAGAVTLRLPHSEMGAHSL